MLLAGEQWWSKMACGSWFLLRKLYGLEVSIGLCYQTLCLSEERWWDVALLAPWALWVGQFHDIGVLGGPWMEEGEELVVICGITDRSIWEVWCRSWDGLQRMARSKALYLLEWGLFSDHLKPVSTAAPQWLSIPAWLFWWVFFLFHMGNKDSDADVLNAAVAEPLTSLFSFSSSNTSLGQLKCT